MSGFENLATNSDVVSPDYANIYFDGTVVDNVDPMGLDRVKATIPHLYEGPVEDLPWVLPFKELTATGQGDGFGVYGSPAIGASVVILLQNGDPHYPVYVGGLHKKANAFFPSGKSWGFQDKYGNRVRFSDDLQITVEAAAGVSIVISPDGTVSVGARKDVNITSGGAMNLTAGADLNLVASGDAVIRASKIFFQRG